MKPYTLDNHFVYGYGDGVFNPEDKKQTPTLLCKYSKASHIPTSFREECNTTALQLADQAKSLNRLPMILLSGGLDSEVVAKTFIDANIDFQPVTFRFTNELNIHEINYVEKFCKRHNLKPRYLDIDIVSWLDTAEAKNKFDESFCNYTEMLPHMKLMDMIWDEWQGIPILGNGDFFTVRYVNPVWRMRDRSTNQYIWKYVEYEYILAWFRYAVAKNMLGGLGFFQHNAEITLAMALEPEMVHICNDLDPFKMSSRSTKYAIYRKYWNDLEMRPKWNGGELVSNLHFIKSIEFKKDITTSFTDQWTMEYNEFTKMLLL